MKPATAGLVLLLAVIAVTRAAVGRLQQVF